MRTAIMQQIRETPGIHLRGLTQELDCTTTTLTYHLSDLPVRSRDIRSYKRLYPASLPEDRDRSLAALNHPQRGPMLYHIDSGHSLGTIADLLDITRQTISSHLTVLTNDGLVTATQNGRAKELNLQEQTKTTLRRYGNRILDQHVDNFIAMWQR